MPAVSQQQQKLFGLALAVKRGEVARSEASEEVLNIVDSMSEKDIEDYASTKHAGLPSKVESQLRGVVREIMRERVLSEAAGKEAMGIAAFTGTRGDAVQKFIDDNNLDAKKLFNYVKGGKLKERMDFVSALVGNPGNKIQKMIVSKFGMKESVVNEDTKKRFDVDFYKNSITSGTSHEEIIRGDKFSDVVSQATKVAKSKGMDYVEFYYKDAFIGSIAKKNNYTFKKGRYSDKSPLSVNEGVSPKDMEKIKGAVEAASSFMGIGSELKKTGLRYIFATSPMPVYIVQPTPNNKVAIVNKKYASKPDFVIGDTAVGVMESINLVREEKYPIAVEKFNKELIKHPMVKKAAQFYKKTPAEIVKAVQQRLYTKGDKTGNTKEVWIDFKDTTSGITIKHKMKFNESVNEASYNFGKEEYTKKNLTPTQILDLAMGYLQTPITKLVGKTLGHRVNVANDLSKLTGTSQLDASARGKSPALILFLLKNELVTKDEYIKLYKDLVLKHKAVIKYLKNASPEMRGAGGAARAAAKDMKGEFDID